MLHGLVAIFGFRIFSDDVAYKYLQGTENLLFDIFVKLCEECELSPVKLLKHLQPLYGIAESGANWGRIFRKHLLNDIGVQASVSDPILFYKHFGQGLIVLCAAYVDDTLHEHNKQKSDECSKTETAFSHKIQECDEAQFSGLEMKTNNTWYVTDQTTGGHRLHSLKTSIKIRIFSIFAL